MKNLFKLKPLLHLFFIFLIALGIISRSVESLSGNYVWGFDQGRDYLIVKDIVDLHNLRLVGTVLGAGSAGIQGIFHGPGYYYFLAIPYIIFQGDPYGGVVLMLIFGLGTLAVGFLLGKKMLGNTGGLFLTTLLAISPPLIAQSRFIWNSFPSTFFVMLSLLFTYLINVPKVKKQNLLIFLSAFFAGFVYNFEFAIAVPLTLGLIIYCIIIFRRKKIMRYIFLFLGFLMAYLPMILFEIRHSFMALNGLYIYFTSPHKANSFSYIQNLADHFGAFPYNLIDTFPRQTIISPLLLFIILALFLVILIKKEKKQEIKNFFLYLTILPVFTFIVLSFLRNTVYQYYLFHLCTVYIIIFAYIIVSLFKRGKKEGILIFSLIFLLFVVNFLSVYPKMIIFDLKDDGGNAKMKGKKDAIDYIYKDAGNREFGFLVFSPPVYTYPYDYAIQWYGAKQYKYIPHNEKKGLFYLLIEVDPSKPWSYKGWLETVIKDGRIIDTVNLPSGLIIQKRISE